MELLNLETGEIYDKGVRVTVRIAPQDMTNEQLKKYLDEQDYKLSYTVDYKSWKKQNTEINISKILSNDKGNPDYTLIGFFDVLCSLSANYKNTVNFQYEKDLMEKVGCKKTTYNKYMKRLKEEGLVKVIKYNNHKCLVINPVYMSKGFCLSAPVFLAFKDLLKKRLEPYVFEYYRRIYECGNVIKLRTYKTRYTD